ncbi:hypothetical protein E7Z59_08805 [Robertkochia marina]|uniref:Sulfotransferase n=1 Tax=Robertkochia marina TaxID=1227945 RepID=A0A4S3M044_9FLAO|nr:sulfotransferase [Robertkochia marina]THD67744.1 hypothetical protein E7Z59_08805 [Robertkochia marina]TRZ40957.1 hypothetical protein D3A96_14490 [Robertkochia marina]
MQLLYIMSDIRSGSTLLENILSKSPETISVGELRLLDSHLHKGIWGRRWNWCCSCGEEFGNCTFWKAVFDEMGLESPQEIAQTMMNRPPLTKEDQLENDAMLRLFERIYQAVFKVSGAKCIIDSSKEPFQGLSVYKHMPFPVKIIYLERDLRAVTLSKSKWNKINHDLRPNLTKTLLLSFRIRLICHRLLKQVKPGDVYRMTYEDFLKRPQYHLDAITRFADIPPIQMPEYMELEEDHTIAGTPNRFTKRPIKFDDSWKHKVTNKPVFNALGGLLNAF